MRYLLLFAALMAVAAQAQDCSLSFTTPQFAVQVDSNVWYGNAPRYDGGTDSLFLNLYKPVGDGQTERPLIIFIHGGGFYAGHRNANNTACYNLASAGWAAATISYRLGFYGTWLFGPPYAHDPSEFRRAAYRSMQDTKGAIRYLKGRHAMDSTSTSAVFTFGGSAGAIAALHAAYLDAPSEKPDDCGAINDVQHILNFYPRPDLGGVDGDLHLNGYDASVLGVVNIFGALIDTAMIASSDDAALFSYHQTLDPIVGCGLQRPYWNYGLGVTDNYPWIHGSCSIDQRMQNLGFTSDRYVFLEHPGNEHAVHDPVTVTMASLAWMRELMCAATTAIGDVDQQPAFLMYPNPASMQFVIRHAGQGPATLSLLDATGRTVRTHPILTTETTIGLHGLAKGAYMVRLETDQGIAAQRLMVE